MENSAPTARVAGQKWTAASSVSAVISAFLASLCCVGPLVFAVLGVAGAGLLSWFEPYRPYLMGLTFALLATAFYFVYRRPRAPQGNACACPETGASRFSKFMLWIATILVLAFLSLPYVAVYLLG